MVHDAMVRRTSCGCNMSLSVNSIPKNVDNLIVLTSSDCKLDISDISDLPSAS